MQLLDDLATHWQIEDPEEQRLISNVSWAQYETLLAERGDSLAYRVNYLDGVLEIVAPSRRHESGKTRIGTLLEIYFLEAEIEYFPTGSTTFRQAQQQVGLEPDESYCIGSEKEIPDLAIEVIVTSSGMNRLERFRRLGISEVWFWQGDRFSIYHLREQIPESFLQTAGYELVQHSELLPELDVEFLSECVRNPNPLAAAKAFRQSVRQQMGLNEGDRPS
ncbi:Uma2 family endonuclease [Thermoleptolyngbya sp. M55_K2018_002]|uniref:Uma2 family endonuclease n=1 Tax=Thermoleptolyngbya sp. M55_K2018_002 TaxID=2747808 RepID=UPI001A065C82|nr:Uma2 family endonuclease [Thermoleptolyngbya sp. M55_K2018_002]HIK39230.1 Uma2 family endonuclease [Thermoleptolyngbya sp. M55_K2018_002]